MDSDNWLEDYSLVDYVVDVEHVMPVGEPVAEELLLLRLVLLAVLLVLYQNEGMA